MRAIRLLLLLTVIFVIRTLSSQVVNVPIRTAEEEAAKQTAMLQRTITLSEGQVDTVYAIHLKFATLRRMPQYADKHRQLFEQMISELRMVLSEQQYDDLRKIQAERKRIMQKPVVVLTDSVEQAPTVAVTDTMQRLEAGR